MKENISNEIKLSVHLMSSTCYIMYVHTYINLRLVMV